MRGADDGGSATIHPAEEILREVASQHQFARLFRALNRCQLHIFVTSSRLYLVQAMAHIRIDQAPLPPYGVLLAVLLAESALLLPYLRIIYRCTSNRVFELVLEGLRAAVVELGREAILKLPILSRECLQRLAERGQLPVLGLGRTPPVAVLAVKRGVLLVNERRCIPLCCRDMPQMLLVKYLFKFYMFLTYLNYMQDILPTCEI